MLVRYTQLCMHTLMEYQLAVVLTLSVLRTYMYVFLNDARPLKTYMYVLKLPY